MQQKTLSLLQFQKKFGTEKACQKQLFRLRWPEGFKCLANLVAHGPHGFVALDL